jgi:hypothetical protein
VAKIFYTPPGYTGQAELTASTGLTTVDLALWRFSRSGYNDGATFGLSLGHPRPLEGGELKVQAQNWPIENIGNQLTAYQDPVTGATYPASQCRITLRGRWQVTRQPNSNSFNSIGIEYSGRTETDLGSRAQGPTLLSLTTAYATYIIQGSGVTGGAQDTFSSHVFYCQCTEAAATDNSNRLFQSNTTIRPVWDYTYAKSWEIEV